MSRLRPIIGFVLISFLLFFLAIRTHAKTDAAKELAQEKAAAARRLAELQKRTVPASPLFWLLFAGALICFVSAVVLLISGARVGPPFGW
jgi:hypothetical protein